MNHRLTVSLAVALSAALALPPAAARAAQETPSATDPAMAPTSVERRSFGSLAGAYLAARHASLNKDLPSAAGFYARALDRDPGNVELLDRSVLMNVASGNIARAADLARELLENAPRDQVALVTVAVHALRGGDLEEARARLEELGTLGGPLQELVAGLLTAWAMAAEGDPARAVSRLDELSGPAWFNAFTKRHAGLIADQAELFHIAEDRLRLAYERDPAALRVVDAYARILARAGKTERALEVIDRFEARIGGNGTFTGALRDEIASGDVAPQAPSPREGAAEVLYDIGSAVGTEGSSDTFAASLLQLSLYLAPDAHYPAIALGSVYESMEQHEAAIEVYRAVPDDAPLHRDARIQEALNLNVLERHDEAISLLEALVAEDPDDLSTATALGNVYRSLERFEEAAKVYGTSIEALDEVPPAYWTLHYYRGISFERMGEWPKAEADFRKALELEPEQPLVLNYLGYSWIDRGENLEEALDMVRRAVAARPDDGYIVDSLGWAYYRLGRYEEAVDELERAATLRPLDPVINDHLGDAYWKVGRKLEATFQWQHALDNDPDDELRAEIEAKLETGLDAEAAQTAADASEATPATPASRAE